jgi:hypothetical protein
MLQLRATNSKLSSPLFEERGKSVRPIGKSYVDVTDWGEFTDPAGSAKKGFSLLKHRQHGRPMLQLRVTYSKLSSPLFEERGKSVRHLGKRRVDATDWGEFTDPAGSA